MAVTVVLLMGVAAVVVVHAQHAADQVLLRSAVSQADDVVDPPAGVWLAISDSGKIRATKGTPAGLPVVGDLARVTRTRVSVERTVHVSKARFRVLTAATDHRVVQAALNLTSEDQQRNRLFAALGISGLVGLGSAILIGSLLGRRAVRPLSDALRLQRQFVADASHELRTPLTLLSMRAQLLERALAQRSSEESTRRDAAGIVSDADHLAEIVTDLLNAADHNTPSTLTDIGAVVRDVATSSESYARARAIDIEYVDPGETTFGAVQTAALRRAFTALIDNAIEHSPTDGVVSIACSRQRQTFTVTVSDQGSGISKDAQAAMFDRFHSGAATGERRRYGLGLALAAEVVARHGGRLEVRSRNGQAGTVFAIVLPRDARGQARRERNS